MRVDYRSAKIHDQCNSFSEAKKLFGGNEALARSLMARINALNSAETLKDIVMQPQFHFHPLHNYGKSEKCDMYAIDVKTRADPWRIILTPVTEDTQSSETVDIIRIAKEIRIIEITEVSKHYE